MSVEINNLSLVELQELQKKVATQIQRKEAQDKASAKARLAEVARELGFDLKTLMGDDSGKKVGKKVPIKYRNSSNADETWTGRGRKPKWLAKALEGGAKIEDFAI